MWVSPTKKVLLLDIFTQGCLSCTLEVHKLTGLMHISWCDLPCSFKRNFSVACFLQLYTLLICAVCFVSFFPCSTTAQNRCMCIDFIQDSNLQICDILWHSSMIWSCYVKIAKNFQPLYTTGGFNWCDPSSEMAILKLEVLPNRTISLRSRAYIANITNTCFKMLNQLSLSNQILLNPWNKLRSALKKNI